MKNSTKKSFHRESGFTLIELLIVIVIIGILAGILIVIINPIRQQNRARNASVRSAMLKVAFSVNAARAGEGKLPVSDNIANELENVTMVTGQCTGSTTLNCLFNVNGIKLPSRCGTGADSVVPGAVATNQCNMRLLAVGDLDLGRFRVVAAAYNLGTSSVVDHIYVFDSSQGLLECGNQTSYTATGDLSISATGTVGNNNCITISE